eukprot:698386-Alexandrium_andersonii.AAC.1
MTEIDKDKGDRGDTVERFCPWVSTMLTPMPRTCYVHCAPVASSDSRGVSENDDANDMADASMLTRGGQHRSVGVWEHLTT